jgi:hypothetical protein
LSSSTSPPAAFGFGGAGPLWRARLAAGQAGPASLFVSCGLRLAEDNNSSRTSSTSTNNNNDNNNNSGPRLLFVYLPVDVQ